MFNFVEMDAANVGRNCPKYATGTRRRTVWCIFTRYLPTRLNTKRKLIQSRGQGRGGGRRCRVF